jgi:hypothetical protein
MIIKVDVNVSAQELVESINRLANMLPELSDENAVEESTKADQTETKVENKPKQVDKSKMKTKKQAIKEITLEEVRAKLAALSQDGKQAQVKALITEFGAKKLSDIPSCKYLELLEKAEVL